VELTNDLLSVLHSTPSTPGRLVEEITLQTSLARALLATKGYTEEAEQAYARALELCETAGEIPQLFPVLRGLISFYVLSNEPDKALQLGERMMQLAERLHDADIKAEGLLVDGYMRAFGESPEAGLKRIEEGLALYSLVRHRTRRLDFGSNPRVVGLAVSALFLWICGYPDRAHNRAVESILLARQLNHPYSLAYSQFHTGLLNMWLRNHDTALESAEALLELAEAHGFQIWHAVGTCLRGAALVNTGATERGLGLVEQGMDTYRGLKTPPVFWSMLLHLGAGAYAVAAKPEEGLRLLNEAMGEHPSSAGAMVCEFLLLKGDLLLAVSSSNDTDAEILYHDALNSAQEADAPMMELRAAMRLARLWQNLGKKEQAKTLLSDVYSKFTEGFSTADLKEASSILGTLSS
jgi:tetratricopeptide (TPR) repeat protein